MKQNEIVTSLGPPPLLKSGMVTRRSLLAYLSHEQAMSHALPTVRTTAPPPSLVHRYIFTSEPIPSLEKRTSHCHVFGPIVSPLGTCFLTALSIWSKVSKTLVFPNQSGAGILGTCKAKKIKSVQIIRPQSKPAEVT